MNLANLLKATPLVSWDFLMILGIFLFFSVLGFFWKKKRMLTIVLSLYLARLFLALFGLPAFAKDLKLGPLTPEVVVFWVFFIALFLLFAAGGIAMSASSGKKESKSKKARYKSIKGLVYGFFSAGLFLNLSLALMSATFISDLSLVGKNIFIGGIVNIAWTIIPLVIMFFLK
ncbi:MAG: hypothetical protein WC242_00070 [Candidatus Paceibacterota bacterium]|jgi:hypothetical protein